MNNLPVHLFHDIHRSVFFFVCGGNAEYKRSAKKDTKGRKMTPGEEEDMEIWAQEYQDDQVRVHLQDECFN